jgi:hypothetical protein
LQRIVKIKCSLFGEYFCEAKKITDLIHKKRLTAFAGKQVSGKKLIPNYKKLLVKIIVKQKDE